MPPAWIALGVLIACMVICVAIPLYIGRRHFYRTHAAGVQEFKSYGRAVRSQLFEFLLTMIALVCFYSTIKDFFRSETLTILPG